MTKLKLNPRANKDCKSCLGTGIKMSMSLFGSGGINHSDCDCLKEEK